VNKERERLIAGLARELEKAKAEALAAGIPEVDMIKTMLRSLVEGWERDAETALKQGDYEEQETLTRCAESIKAVLA
jgi:hypothetical protein